MDAPVSGALGPAAPFPLDVIHLRELGRVAQSAQFGERAIVEDVGDGVARLDHDQPDRAGLEVGAVLARAGRR